MAHARADAEAPCVAVIVVTWNGDETSRRCLRSLGVLRYSNYRVCLVDNGSRPGFATAIAAEFPDVHVLSLPENRGYAGACNAGIAWARTVGADFILLLNDDTTVDPGLVSALLARAQAADAPVIVAPRILFADRPDVTWSAGGYIRQPWFKADHFQKGHDSSRRVQWASGCCLFFPVALVDAVGPWDERYFLYLEDVDWCLRARACGFSTVYEPEARVWHEVSAATGLLDSRIKRYYSYRNHYLLAFTHSGAAGRAWFALHFAVTLAKAAVRSLFFKRYRRDNLYHARTRALLDALRGRWGKAPYDDAVPRDLTPASERAAA